MRHLLLIGALLAISPAHASSVASAQHGHHGYGAGVSGSLKGQSAKSTSSNGQTANSSGGEIGECDVAHYVLCSKGE